MDQQVSPDIICSRCEHRQKPCLGPCRCLADGVEIIVHLRLGKCPHRFFELTAEEAAAMFPDAPGVPNHGPGTELTEILKSMGIDIGDCSCPVRAGQMNVWGVDGCRDHRAEIIGWLQQAEDDKDWIAKVKAGINAAAHGLPLTIAGLVDEAIRRADKKQQPSPN